MYAAAAAIAAPPSVALVAEAATSSGLDPYSLIGTVLTPVIVVCLLLAGKLHTHGEVTRLEESNVQLRAQNQNLQEALVERAVPALTRSAMVLEQLAPYLDNPPPRRRREVT